MLVAELKLKWLEINTFLILSHVLFESLAQVLKGQILHFQTLMFLDLAHIDLQVISATLRIGIGKYLRLCTDELKVLFMDLVHQEELMRMR
jgi:hypothetical protein